MNNRLIPEEEEDSENISEDHELNVSPSAVKGGHSPSTIQRLSQTSMKDNLPSIYREGDKDDLLR